MFFGQFFFSTVRFYLHVSVHCHASLLQSNWTPTNIELDVHTYVTSIAAETDS
jgi:hypothetical protein